MEDNENTRETIVKLRNKMSPVVNYFAMKGINRSDCKSDEEFADLQDFIDQELQNCFNIMPKILELLGDDNWK